MYILRVGLIYPRLTLICSRECPSAGITGGFFFFTITRSRGTGGRTPGPCALSRATLAEFKEHITSGGDWSLRSSIGHIQKDTERLGSFHFDFLS